MLDTIRFPRRLRFFLGLALALLSGCTTARNAAPKTCTFFPPAPDEPRVQFLTAFSSGRDLGGKSSFADFITGKPLGVSSLVKPYGLHLREGKLYVCDTMAAGIQVFDLVKNRSRWFAPRGEGRLLMPINITIDADGTRYVADAGRNQVMIYGSDETWLGAMGVKEEMRPADIALTSDRLYVSDVKGHCVRVYGKARRELLFTIPRDPKGAEGKLFSPTSLALDPQGRLLVSDAGAFAVQVYDGDGKFLRTIGRQGVAPGLFARPKGVAADREGRVYVVDAATQVVQAFDREGTLLLYFGAPGASSEGELYLPAAVKIDYDNTALFQRKVAPGYELDYLILVISQFGDRKVNVYGFLKKK